jgi:hypothetical protein
MLIFCLLDLFAFFFVCPENKYLKIFVMLSPDSHFHSFQLLASLFVHSLLMRVFNIQKALELTLRL